MIETLFCRCFVAKCRWIMTANSVQYSYLKFTLVLGGKKDLLIDMTCQIICCFLVRDRVGTWEAR